METLRTRCCIAGGGPAGIMLGYLLARAGIDVIVLEKWADFFRDFRGDTIHPSTMDVLYELGLLEEFLKLPHSEMQQMAAHIGGEEIVMADFARLKARCPYIAFIPQWDFLNFLSTKAKAFPEFHLVMETEATDIIEEGDGENRRVVGVRATSKVGAKENEPGKQFEIRADLVVGADGRHSTIREKARLAIEDLGAPIDVLWFRLSRTDDGTKRSLGYIDAGRGLVLLDRNDYWQCGFIIKKGGFDEIKLHGLEAFKKDLATLAPFLSPVVGELKDWDQVKLLSVSVDRLRTWYRDGLLCIGDSAHAMSPIGGVGINLAIQDAVAAANFLIPVFKKYSSGSAASASAAVLFSADLTAACAAIQKRREFPTRLTQGLQVFLHRRVFAAALQSNHNGHMQVPWFMHLVKNIPMLQKIPAYIIGIGFRPEHIELLKVLPRKK